MEIQQQQDFFVVVEAVDHHPFLVLRVLGNRPALLFHEQLQIGSASVLHTKPLDFPVGFVPDKDLHVHIISGAVEVIEWKYFASYLNNVILKKYVLDL